MSGPPDLPIGTPVVITDGLFRLDQWDPLYAAPISAPFYPKGETGTVTSRHAEYVKGAWRVSVRMESDGETIPLVPVSALEEL